MGGGLGRNLAEGLEGDPAEKSKPQSQEIQEPILGHCVLPRPGVIVRVPFGVSARPMQE